MATITRTPGGRWKAIIRKRGWPTAVKTFRTKRDAQDWARTTEDEMVRGVYISRAGAERLTLEVAMQRYLNEVSPTKSKGTVAREKDRSAHLLKSMGAYALAAITPDILARYRDDRLATGAANNSVRLELALLSHMYTIAIREWRIGVFYNPVSAIRKPASGQGRNRRLLRSVPDQGKVDEQTRLLKACSAHSNPMLGWIVRLALSTGMRAGEIQTLRRGQVDLSRRIIRLTETKNGSVRTVPLSREAVVVLKDALAHPVRPLDTDLIFWGEPGKDGKRRPYEFRPAWRRALKLAGITGLRFHDLRHEAVSRLVEAGLSDQEVAAISGHKSMQMLKRYTHLRAEDLVEKLDKLSNLQDSQS